MRQFGLAIVGGSLATARGADVAYESVGQTADLETLLEDLIAELRPTDALERELVANGGSR